MSSAWPAIVFGWPAVLAALVAFAGAIAHRRAAWAAAGAILATPFCVYANGFPAIRGVGLAVVLLNGLVVAAVWRRRILLGAVLLVPFVVLAGLLAAVAAFDALGFHRR